MSKSLPLCLTVVPCWHFVLLSMWHTLLLAKILFINKNHKNRTKKIIDMSEEKKRKQEEELIGAQHVSESKGEGHEESSKKKDIQDFPFIKTVLTKL